MSRPSGFDDPADKKKLSFSGSIREATRQSDVILSRSARLQKNGDADLTYVENVAREIALGMNSYKLIVEKSDPRRDRQTDRTDHSVEHAAKI